MLFLSYVSVILILGFCDRPHLYEHFSFEIWEAWCALGHVLPHHSRSTFKISTFFLSPDESLNLLVRCVLLGRPAKACIVCAPRVGGTWIFAQLNLMCRPARAWRCSGTPHTVWKPSIPDMQTNCCCQVFLICWAVVVLSVLQLPSKQWSRGTLSIRSQMTHASR